MIRKLLKITFMFLFVMILASSGFTTARLSAKADSAKPVLEEISQEIETLRVASGGKDYKANLIRESTGSSTLSYGEQKETIETTDKTLGYIVDGQDDGSYVIHAKVDEAVSGEEPFSRTTSVISYNSSIKDFENKPTFILFKIAEIVTDSSFEPQGTKPPSYY